MNPSPIKTVTVSEELWEYLLRLIKSSYPIRYHRNSDGVITALGFEFPDFNDSRQYNVNDVVKVPRPATTVKVNIDASEFDKKLKEFYEKTFPGNPKADYNKQCDNAEAYSDLRVKVKEWKDYIKAEQLSERAKRQAEEEMRNEDPNFQRGAE